MGKRVNSTKKERTELLKKLGYTESDMQKFWDECIPVNSKIRMLSEAGLNWTDLCVWQIEQLPTLKETTLEQLRLKEEADNKAKQEKIKKEKAEKYYNEHFEELMLEKMDKNEELTEKELRRLVFEGNEVERSYGENRRWSRTVHSYICINNRYFEIIWEQGLTEEQEDSFDTQPFEVHMCEYEKVTTVREWRKGAGVSQHKKLNIPVSDDVIYEVIDKVTEFMYCNFGDCHMEKITWNELEEVRNCIKEYALDMIKSGLN